MLQAIRELDEQRVVVREGATVYQLLAVEDEGGVGAEDKVQDVVKFGTSIDELLHVVLLGKLNQHNSLSCVIDCSFV